jgi:hypothetical protein
MGGKKRQAYREEIQRLYFGGTRVPDSSGDFEQRECDNKHTGQADNQQASYF